MRSRLAVSAFGIYLWLKISAQHNINELFVRDLIDALHSFVLRHKTPFSCLFFKIKTDTKRYTTGLMGVYAMVLAFIVQVRTGNQERLVVQLLMGK